MAHKIIKFKARPYRYMDETARDGEEGWDVFVDDKLVIENLSNNHMDVSDNCLDPAWAVAGVRLVFDFEVS